ncbi:MAG: beta-propeller domain-containing protein [Oscillospiraceae bacterium]|nr:beta-propeller domain-containing protein [Oscillospiraceae bacterium]
MKNDFEDKDITINQDEIKQTLKKLDDYLIIPDSIRPENIDLTFKKISINYVKPIAAAACLVLFLLGIVLRLNLQNSIISKNNDELKSIYFSFHNNDTSNTTSLEMEGALPYSANNSRNFAPDVSSTNIQVEGVDEGDIVKTDGDYIYSINNNFYLDKSKNDGYYKSIYTINITSTIKNGEFKKISSFNIEGQPLEMYLKDKKLVVIISPQAQYLDIKTNEILTQEEYDQKVQELYSNSTISEDESNDFFYRYQYQSLTTALIYDVSDPANPQLKREFSQEGYYSSSRLIEDDLYLITNKSDYAIIYNTKEDINLNNIVPFTIDSIDGGNRKAMSSTDIKIFENPNGYSFVLVSGINIKNDKKAVTKACLGGSDIIYCSLNSLYITSRYYGEQTQPSGRIAIDMIMPSNSDTDIIKCNLKSGKPDFYASARIPGSILNQYSLDEYDGYLRVATTKGNLLDTTGENISKNNLYVLDDKLNIIGKIEDLTPGEQIYSTRFIGDKGYLVTFKQVDPLFAIDLSNPKEPKIIGELKIPGFSQYLQPVSENLLIGIGNNTETIVKKDTDAVITTTTGMKLSLFDVSDPSDPKEIQNYMLGASGTYSEVLYNPKALLYSKEKNIIAFPVSLTEGDNFNITFIGYYIFGFDEVTGFTLKGRVTHYDKLPGNDYIDDKTYYDSIGFDIKRGVFVDDVLYTISDKMIQANSLSDFSLIGKVQLN